MLKKKKKKKKKERGKKKERKEEKKRVSAPLSNPINFFFLSPSHFLF
jgi:hypothetical protein